MALNLYRRHAQACQAGRPRYVCSGEFEERKKGWKRCMCVIFASGTLGGRFRRRGTEKVDWEAAKAVASAWEAAGTWESDSAAIATAPASPPPSSPRWVPEPEPEPPTPVLKLRATIIEAGQAFLTNRETKQVAAATLRFHLKRGAACLASVMRQPKGKDQPRPPKCEAFQRGLWFTYYEPFLATTIVLTN